MKVFLECSFFCFLLIFSQVFSAEPVTFDKQIRQTLDESIRDLNSELRKVNSSEDGTGPITNISDEKVELQVDQSILDSVCIECPKLANLSSQVNSALKKMVDTSKLKESNLALELQNLEAMTYVVKDTVKKNQGHQCSISNDASFSQLVSSNQLDSKLAVLILSKVVDNGSISSVQNYKANQQKVFYYRGKAPHQDKIVRVTVLSNKNAKVDYFVLTKDVKAAQDVKAKLSQARQTENSDCSSSRGLKSQSDLVGQVEVASDDCKSKLSVQAGLGMTSSKDSSGADQIGEIKLVDIQARIVEGPVGANISGLVTNRGTTARIGLGGENREMIYTRLTDINGGEVSGGVPYEMKIPGKAGATISGDFNWRENLKTNAQSEQVTIKVQPNFMGTSFSASAQVNNQVKKNQTFTSENYSLEVNQPVGPGNLCFRYSFQMVNAELRNPTYWACYRVRF